MKIPDFDGHKFIPEAIKKGATGFVIENSYAAGIDIDSYAHKIVLSVKDTLKFMQDASLSLHQDDQILWL
ncbi:MAG: hypothetical protein U5N58_03865 [Actinomycetota bacterium]|nr:hypothetical protein [Actinomycetota bacterium]